jgi:4-hydroxybenzoate polyprenyltransferase/geranylgeranylglycerol-phosphate geranylgeranyltransferase
VSSLPAHPIYSPVDLEFWPRFGVTLRPYLLPVSAIAGLTGLALVPGVPAITYVPALAAFLLAYGFGQALTDVFQTDTDARSSPYRPLVRGEIGRGAVFGVALSGLLLCGTLLALLNPWNLVLAAAAVLGLLAYSPLKRIFWAGPPCNSAVMALLPAMGLLCVEPSLASSIGNPLLLPAMVSVFFSYAVFVLLGYLKDVDADAATGYDTLPVRFGRRTTVVVSGVCASTAVGFSAVLVSRGVETIGPWLLLAAVLWIGGIALLARSHLLAFHSQRDGDAHPAIELSVVAFVALHAGEVCLIAPALSWSAVLVLGLSWWLLKRRPCREQV